ncbi:MAG: 7-cyano-7-deazaguanine synthase QueC [Thermoplasmata archaeon]|nr:MAG: 7-cyano-7-deazaguanine synthase QueC [Thermoplasmata archaeon]
MTKKAVVLLSGGLDSTVTLAKAKEGGYEIYTLSFDYGQRHKRELASAEKIADFYDVSEHKVLRIDLPQIGGSALTDLSIDLPQERSGNQIGSDIPATYVPARNTILLSLAVAYAEVVGAEAVFIGANAIDYSGYPDCRPEFLEAFQKVTELGTKRGVEGRPVEIKYPLINSGKSGIVMEGVRLNVPLHLTWSCYRGGDAACGKCDSCILRLRGFKEAGVEDPIEYENEGEDL